MFSAKHRQSNPTYFSFFKQAFMSFVQSILRKVDPDRLISGKSWWIIATLAALAGLLFAATVLLMTLGERSILKNVDMHDKFVGTSLLGKELDSLQRFMRQYERNLWTYVAQGDKVDLENTLRLQQEIVESRTGIDTLLLPQDKQLLLKIANLTDSAFAGGVRAIDNKLRIGDEAAFAELVQIEAFKLDDTIAELSNRIYRNRVQRLHNEIESDAAKARGSIQNTMTLLSALAGFVFTFLLFVIVRTVRGVMHDRRAYHKLYEEQKKVTMFTRNLIDLSPVGYHSINSNGIIIEMNKTELDWLGYNREEIIGKKHVTELYSDDNRPRFEGLFRKLKAEGILTNEELIFLTKSNEPVPILFNSKAIYDAKGHFSHSISTVYNFTERKKLEDELINARQEAENANRLKQSFMANMSHEIRTPLNAIIGFGNLLNRSELPPNLREYVHSIQVSGNNLLSIVNDILDFEKISSGMFHSEHVQFDLPGLLHSVLTMVRTSAEEKKLALRLETDPNIPTLLTGDPMHVTQVLMNLLFNAVKFTETGSVTLRVRTLPGKEKNEKVRIVFDVADTGIGIPASEQTRIFERFTQASSDTTRKYGGTGLGLALVKLIVELLEGSVRLESEVGRGSTFTVEIPFQKGPKQEQTVFAENITDSNMPDMSGYQILLVEDNPMNRRIAELNLLEFGLEVTQAENGCEALEILRENPDAFDLVLMDIQMPEMDGYNTTQAIRSELGLGNLPIVAMTAHVLAGEREKVIACGMNDYLTKPVRHAELVNMLQHYLPGLWDSRALNEFARGKTENMREITGLFIRQLPIDLADLHIALQNKEYQKVAAVAHNLRSTAGYAGFQASLGKILVQLETEARTTSPNHTMLTRLYSKLAQTGRQAVSILERHVFGEN